MSDNTKFEVKIFPAQFDDANKGTIVSIVINHGLEKPIFPPKLSALRSLAKSEFKAAVEGCSGSDVTSSLVDNNKLNGQYTVAAVHIPHKYESPNTADKVQLVVNQLNLAFAN